MKLYSKKTKSLIFSTFFFFTMVQIGHACDVPVCDIPGTIANLEKGTVDTRATFLGDLYQKTKSLNNVDTLKNLHEFSAQSYELQKRLGDPENVLAWSIFLRENSIYGLLKFAPFDVEFMKSIYDESFKISDLSVDRQLRIRYDSYQRWRAQISTIMDVQYIYNLYSFVYFAKKESEDGKDEDYVIREAAAVLDLLGKRLSFLYPSYEGVFEVTSACSSETNACSDIDMKVNRIVFLNSLSDMGIFSSVYSAKDTIQNYMFTKTVIESFGTKLYSLTEPMANTGRPSEIYVQLNNNQDVDGYVLSSRYAGTLHFQGKVIYTPIKFYTDEGTLGHTPVIPGKYQGKWGDKDVTMILRQKKSKALMATMFVGNGDTGVMVDFPNGEYVDHRGIINLVGVVPQKMEPYKINMAYRADSAGNYRWTGGYFNTAGKFETVEMKRVSDIDLSVDNKSLLNLKLH